MIDVGPARAEDVAPAARLAARLVREHHAYDPLRFMCLEPIEPGYARFLDSQREREGVAFLVARRDEAVVGYIYATIEERDWSDLRDRCGKIHDVYVEDAWRGEGVASRLVEEAVAALTRMGAPRVVLMAAWRNEMARKVFGRLGFRPTMIEMTREVAP